MIKVKQIIVYVFMFFILINSYAFAQNAEEIVKYRKNIMKAIGSHISVIASNVKGKVVIESDIIPHAKALYLSISSINIEKTFPSNTSTNDNLKTRALPAVWEKPNEFTLAMNNSVKKADELLSAAETKDIKLIAKALGGLGKSCGACHKIFRKEK
jgi:cytochrome c556